MSQRRGSISNLSGSDSQGDHSNKIVGWIFSFFLKHYPLFHRLYKFAKYCLPAFLMFLVHRFFNQRAMDVLSKRVQKVEMQLNPSIKDTRKTWQVPNKIPYIDYSSSDDDE
ncbi:hypothetical protein AKO1_006532 [Acrasis kona]|uniref:Uncharacterized protein n=1 Tax=Acrasis kona TaxID=1008807 RepID=A0AAW2ZLA8_9EUKA